MNDYRSYFDRVKVSNTLHQKLLSGEREEKRRAPVLVRYGSMVACLALICLVGFGVWRWSTPHVGGDITAGDSMIPGEKDTYGPGETPPALAPPTPVPSEEPPALSLVFTDRTNDPEPAASIAFPKGYFMLPLTEEGSLELLGIAKPLLWEEEPYTVTGELIFDGEGLLWRAIIYGTSRKDADKTFTIQLAYGQLPPECVVYEDGEKNEVDGVSVQADYLVYDRNGDGRDEYVSRTAFMNREVGVRLEAVEQADTRWFVETMTLAILQGSGGRWCKAIREEIPEWRSEKLTLAQARAEEGFGKYVPTWVPDRFGFESSWRELGQNRDWLSVCWTGYYTDISISIYRTELYPQADSDEAPIPVAELTGDLLMAQFQYVDSDAGDVSGYRARFAVDYGDGFTAQYNIKGVTPEEAVKLLDTPKTAAGAWGWPMPGNYTISTPFGTRVHPITGREHSSNGLGIKADRGTEVLAAADGTVDQAGYDETLGNYVKLNHGDDRFTLYGHVSGKEWKAGDSVKQGEVLGQVDQSGTATGPFLYLESLIDGEYIDPLGQYASLRESFRYQ